MKLEIEGAVRPSVADAADVMVVFLILVLTAGIEDPLPHDFAQELPANADIKEIFCVFVDFPAMCQQVLSRAEVKFADFAASPREILDNFPRRLRNVLAEGDAFAFGVQMHHQLNISLIVVFDYDNERVELALEMLFKLCVALIREVAPFAIEFFLPGFECHLPAVFLRLFR